MMSRPEHPIADLDKLSSSNPMPEIAPPVSEESSKSLKFLNWASILFAILQSLCTAVIAISGLRVLIGLTALAASYGIHAPARGFHGDAIRIPMMAIALIGSLINLFVIYRIRSLRGRPSSQWRQKMVPLKKLNAERFQILLAIVTLFLLAAEWFTHPMVHIVP
jgi:hypothetical protein